MDKLVKFKQLMNLTIVAVDEINSQRMLMQKKELTPTLTPIFQSVQTLIGKQRVKEAKLFTGKESIALDSQLFEIPLMDEEANQYRKVFEMKKNNHDLLKFNKIDLKIKDISEKLKDENKSISLKFIENKEDQPEIFNLKNTSYKKKQSKQQSIESRIQFKQKQLASELAKKHFFQQKIQLQNKKKQHYKECDQRIKALYFEKQSEDQISELNSPTLQQSRSLNKSQFLKNTQQKKTLTVDTNLKRTSIDQSDVINPNKNNSNSSSPVKKKLSSIYFPNESISKNSNIVDKSQNNNSFVNQQQQQNLLSPLRLTQLTISNSNSILDSNQKLDQISKAQRQSLIYPYKLLDIKEKAEKSEKLNIKAEKQLISESIQTMLDSILEEKQKKKQRQSTVFQNKLQSQKQELQYLSQSSGSSENTYFIDNLNQPKIRNLSVENQKLTKSNFNSTNNIFFNSSYAPQNETELEFDDDQILKMQKNKIRGERLIQLKKKLGLIDQNTLKNEQIDQIVKEIETIHKDQEEDLKEQLKVQRQKSLQKSRQQKKADLTFSKNENYQLLKRLVRQKKGSFQNNYSEGRSHLIQNTSLNQRVNKSVLINQNLSIQDGEDILVGTLLSSSRSHYDQAVQQKRKTQNLVRNDSQKMQRNENSLSSQSFNEKFTGQRRKKTNNEEEEQDNYKIYQKTFWNQTTQQKDQMNLSTQLSFRQKNSTNKFTEPNSLSPSDNRIFNIMNKKKESRKINTFNNQTSRENLTQTSDDENRGLNLFKNLSKAESKKLSEKTSNSLRLKKINGVSSSENYGFLENIESSTNNRYQGQLRSRLQNNSLNKRVDQQSESNPILIQSFHVNNENSLLDQSNTQHKLYQQKNYMKHFFKQKVNLKKEFGEKVTESDKETFVCKEKVSNFFEKLLEYQEQSQQNSKKINTQINKSIKTFSSHLVGWKNELQETNQDFNNYLQFNKLKNDKNNTPFDKMQDQSTKNTLK